MDESKTTWVNFFQVTLVVRGFTEINVNQYGAIGIIACVVIGYLASLGWSLGASHPDGNPYKKLVKKYGN